MFVICYSYNQVMLCIKWFLTLWHSDNVMWKSIVIENNFRNAKKMICASMFNISNHYGIKWLSNLLRFEPCNVMFKLIFDKMGHWDDTWNRIVIAIIFHNAICALMFNKRNCYGIKCLCNLLHLEPCNDRYEVNSDRMEIVKFNCDCN